MSEQLSKFEKWTLCFQFFSTILITGSLIYTGIQFQVLVEKEKRSKEVYTIEYMVPLINDLRNKLDIMISSKSGDVDATVDFTNSINVTILMIEQELLSYDIIAKEWGDVLPKLWGVMMRHSVVTDEPNIFERMRKDHIRLRDKSRY